MLNESRFVGSLFFTVILTVLRCVFILMSTPVMVPCTTVPFLSSIVTVSLLIFIRNLTSFMANDESAENGEKIRGVREEGCRKDGCVSYATDV